MNDSKSSNSLSQNVQLEPSGNEDADDADADADDSMMVAEAYQMIPSQDYSQGHIAFLSFFGRIHGIKSNNAEKRLGQFQVNPEV
ncbi:hypothetical protein AKJ16_DCAP09364 [Drosera capensis]